ncbi:MAG: ribbon-helix-helix domain-containing protein [Chloroflexota bacterium]|nr:ribbon-helix-helix domain-containing protein [Chloroflexota bacterium]MDE2940932.1 ribbon-helix-helix domain-containing protein [Chloroflexota bacterium]MDE3268431.1 ribbon-helix-helix domain-containing protein [Chloroflexota bacterium]
MPRTTKTITFSLPPEMADRVDEVMKQQGRSRSEFLREAVLRYIEECEWRQLLQYGEAKAREKGIGPDDVADLVEEYRADVGSIPA